MVVWFIVGAVVGAVSGYWVERLKARGQLIRDAMDYSWKVVSQEGGKPKDFQEVFREVKRIVLDRY